MSDELPLPPKLVDATPNDNVVHRLEVLLEKAKRGEIVAIATAYVVRGGGTFAGYSIAGSGPTRLRHSLFYGIEHAKLAMLDAQFEFDAYSNVDGGA